METVNEGTGGTVGISPPVRRMLVSVLFVCLFLELGMGLETEEGGLRDKSI